MKQERIRKSEFKKIMDYLESRFNTYTHNIKLLLLLNIFFLLLLVLSLQYFIPKIIEIIIMLREHNNIYRYEIIIGIIIAILFYVILPIIPIAFLVRSTIRRLIIKKLIHNLGKFNYFSFKEINTIESIDGILNKIDDLYQIMRKKSGIQDIYKSTEEDILANQFLYIQYILSDLRSDLSIRLTEQQSTLESAKSEIEKNIVGSTELNQVSELQRARLDRQIEQFEELQRVLVKV